MDTSDKSKLDQIIDELIQRGTFTGAALDGIQEMRKEISDFRNSLIATKTRVDSLLAENIELKSNKSALESKLSAWQAKENGIAAREINISKLEAEADKHKALSAQAVDLFKTVFRNTEVRREMFGSVPVNNPTGYPVTMASNETTKTTQE